MTTTKDFPPRGLLVPSTCPNPLLRVLRHLPVMFAFPFLFSFCPFGRVLLLRVHHTLNSWSFYCSHCFFRTRFPSYVDIPSSPWYLLWFCSVGSLHEFSYRVYRDTRIANRFNESRDEIRDLMRYALESIYFLFSDTIGQVLFERVFSFRRPFRSTYRTRSLYLIICSVNDTREIEIEIDWECETNDL